MARSFHRHLGALCRFFTAGRSCSRDQGREPDERVALEQRGHEPALSCIYNFRPQDRNGPSNARAGSFVRMRRRRKLVEAASLADYRLPPRTVFDRAMPRYPNVWFYLDTVACRLVPARRCIWWPINCARPCASERLPRSLQETRKAADFEVTAGAPAAVGRAPHS